MVVNPAALTITASPQSKTYGAALGLGTTAFTTAGLVSGDRVTGVTLTSPGAAATATVAGSPYTITASGATGSGLGNYTISYDTGLLTVNPAALTITASPRVKTYGSTLTLGTTAFTTTGLVNGDTVTHVTLTSAGGGATATVSGSPYAITAGAGNRRGIGQLHDRLRHGPADGQPGGGLVDSSPTSTWLLAGQELSVVAIASTTATSNGQPLIPDGAVTFYDNGAALASQPLAVVAGQDQAVLDTATLPPGRHVITVGYTSAQRKLCH